MRARRQSGPPKETALTGSKAMWWRAPRRGLLVIVALVMTAAAVVAGIRLERPSAAEAPKSAAAPKTQTREQADAALEELAQARGPRPADAPPFTIEPRKDSLAKFPCTKCHDNKLVDARVRPLVEDHRGLLFDHGGTRFWCYDACHNAKNIDSLVTLRGRAVDYDAAYKVCGQCHSIREKDWLFGGHGKRAGAWNAARDIPLTAGELLVTERERIGTWRDARVLLNCTACHDAHSPSIKPFKPNAPPSLRPGIAPGTPVRHPEPKVWEQHLGAERKTR